MSGSAFMDFVIVLAELIITGALIFAAIDFISTDARFKTIAKLAVGGLLTILFLFAVKGVFFGGGGGIAISPINFLYFAIGVILALVVWLILDRLIDKIGWAPVAANKDILKFILGAVVLVAILGWAASSLFGVSLGFYGGPGGGRAQHHVGDVAPAPICRDC